MSLPKIPVSTTLPTSPLPLAHTREPIVTSRLFLRPLAPTDLAASHVLRTQEAVMKWTSVGKVDADLQATKVWIDRFLPPKDESTFNWAITLRSDADGGEGEWIGVGGCHLVPGPEGWPELGYMLRQEFWGKGLATEFVAALLLAWWRLPRSAAHTDVVDDTVLKRSGSADAVELLLAETELKNGGSNRILEKCGFEKFREWEEDGCSLAKWRLKRRQSAR